MTKARARQRAKANAAKKSKKRAAGAEQSNPKIHPGRFDPGAGSITSPGSNASARTFGAAKRGSARSR